MPGLETPFLVVSGLPRFVASAKVLNARGLDDWREDVTFSAVETITSSLLLSNEIKTSVAALRVLASESFNLSHAILHRSCACWLVSLPHFPSVPLDTTQRQRNSNTDFRTRAFFSFFSSSDDMNESLLPNM